MINEGLKTKVLPAVMNDVLQELEPLLNQQPYIDHNYILKQKFNQINIHFRETIVDWIRTVCEQKNLSVPVQVRATFLFDAYCSRQQRPEDVRETVQKYSVIVAICVDIAAKVEGRGIFQLIPTSFKISPSELLGVELEILQAIDYKTCFFGSNQIAEVFLNYLYSQTNPQTCGFHHKLENTLLQVELTMIQLHRAIIYERPIDLAIDALWKIILSSRLSKDMKRSFSLYCREIRCKRNTQVHI